MIGLESITGGEALGERVPDGYGGRFYGVYPAVVSDVRDPEGQGRVKIRLPWSPDGAQEGYEAWARLATMMAGRDRGSWYIPDTDDEVLVCFAAGDVRFPFVLGALWNGRDTPPESMDGGGDNHIKTIKSRSGVTIRIDDQPGQSSLTLSTPAGQEVVLDDADNSVTVRDANGNSTVHNASGIAVTAAAKVKIEAGTVEVSAGMVQVNAGMSKFSGVVQADTVITNAVVSSSYTPGAGNIW
jgi:uncharacterized protein involved in type VI secretion and phage assembly